MSKAAELAQRLARHAEGVCRVYLPEGVKAGAYWLVGDAYGSKGRSCHVRIRGPRSALGQWRDENPASGDHYGDLLDLIRINRDLSMRDAMEEAARFLGDPLSCQCPSDPSAPSVERESDRSPKIEALWRRSKPLAGTLAETYLQARLIKPAESDSLRYHPHAYYRDDDGVLSSGPAIIAAVRDSAGRLLALHRTWVEEDRAIMRKLMGRPGEGLVDLGGDGDVLLVGEGIETVLSFQGLGVEARLAALLSARRLENFNPPSGLSRMLIAVDRDGAGFAAARALRRRAMENGLATGFLFPASRQRGADFNDDRRRLSDDEFRDHVMRQL